MFCFWYKLVDCYIIQISRRFPPQYSKKFLFGIWRLMFSKFLKIKPIQLSIFSYYKKVLEIHVPIVYTFKFILKIVILILNSPKAEKHKVY